jgi:ribose transport system substrate-binding protein
MARRPVVLFTVAISLLYLICGGCSRKRQDDANGKGKIAVVFSTLNNPWFVVLGDAAQSRAQELGYKAIIFDSQNNTARETSHFENITGGYQAILFNPTDADAHRAGPRPLQKSEKF